MRGLEKKRMKWDIQTDRQTDRRTSRLLDRIGPVGRFDENLVAQACKLSWIVKCYLKEEEKYHKISHTCFENSIEPLLAR